MTGMIGMLALHSQLFSLLLTGVLTFAASFLAGYLFAGWRRGEENPLWAKIAFGVLVGVLLLIAAASALAGGRPPLPEPVL